MDIGYGESTSMSACSGNNNMDASDFECNICFDIAQDPIVTRCGHLFCWPCLYIWLNHHSQSYECPVCKALVEEDKLVPLYGRGNKQSDQGSKLYPGIDIPNCPAAERPETAVPVTQSNPLFSFTGGFDTARVGFAQSVNATRGRFVQPVRSTRVRNFRPRMFPSLFNLQIHGFPSSAMYGTTSGFHHGFGHTFYSWLIS